MKAMVVFEVDDLDDVVVYANVYKREQGWKRQIGRLECVKPVPMPQKKESDGTLFTESHIYKSGWNACIEEINATEKVINAKNVALKGETE